MRVAGNLLVDAVGGGEDVLVGDEDPTAVLIARVAEQRRHPRPLALIGRLAAADPRRLFRQLPAAYQHAGRYPMKHR